MENRGLAIGQIPGFIIRDRFYTKATEAFVWLFHLYIVGIVIRDGAVAIAVMKTLQSDLEFIISPVASFRGVDYQNRFDLFSFAVAFANGGIGFFECDFTMCGSGYDFGFWNVAEGAACWRISANSPHSG